MEVAGGLIAVDPSTGHTSRQGVFAGGEIASGPGALIEAIADGKRVAAAMDAFLGGDGLLVRPWTARPAGSYEGTRAQGFADQDRVELPVLPISERCPGFAEVDHCLADEAAAREAGRCLHCDLEQSLGRSADVST